MSFASSLSLMIFSAIVNIRWCVPAYRRENEARHPLLAAAAGWRARSPLRCPAGRARRATAHDGLPCFPHSCTRLFPLKLVQLCGRSVVIRPQGNVLAINRRLRARELLATAVFTFIHLLKTGLMRTHRSEQFS